jgi:hypothetical protein
MKFIRGQDPKETMGIGMAGLWGHLKRGDLLVVVKYGCSWALPGTIVEVTSHPGPKMTEKGTMGKMFDYKLYLDEKALFEENSHHPSKWIMGFDFFRDYFKPFV